MDLHGFLTSLRTGLRTGAFIDSERALVMTGVFGAMSLAGVLLVILTSNGFTDWMGRPLGNDFIVFYAGGKTALADGAAAIYDVERLFAEHQAILDRPSPDWGPFLYPPLFIFVAASLAHLPYAAAWLASMIASGGLYALSTKALAGFRWSLVPILSFSAVFLNFMQGQTGFLVAGLFAGGLAALFSGRSILAGVCFGLIAIKPQFGLLIPLALAAGGYWRAFLAAGVAALSTILLPTIAFGPAIWTGFLDASSIARTFVLEQGGIGYFKIISAFSQARLLGASVEAAYAVQAVFSFSAAIFVFALWRSNASSALKGAGLLVGALLALPYAVEYDLLLLAPAVALLLREAVRDGFRDYEKTILVFVFLAPALSRTLAKACFTSAGWLAIILLAAVIFVRAAPYLGRQPVPAHGPA
ncbi:MAG: glycosyltransferase family 87 protein [Parvularculaceae bacterium]|nr:glycosyltransferase family 87 protein [Parvularculaceae bacterium]